MSFFPNYYHFKYLSSWIASSHTRRARKMATGGGHKCEFVNKGLFYCRNNGWLMENMDMVKIIFYTKFDHSAHSDLLKTTQTQRSYCFRELWDGLTKKKQKKCLLTQQIGLVPVEEVQWKPQGSSFYQSIVFLRNKVKKWTPQCSPIFLWQTLIWHPTLLSKFGFSAISNYNSYFPSIFGIP